MIKKILFVHHVSVIGGASYCLLSIIKELDRGKYFPVVLLRNDGPLVKELQKIDVEVLFCPSLWFYPYNKPLYNLKNLFTIFNLCLSVKDFEQIVNKCTPDIVYFNNALLFPYLRVTKKKNIKSVVHIREHWPGNQHQKQFRYIKEEINEKADRIVAINDYSAKMICPDKKRITVVYDWIDMDSRYEPLPFNKIFGENTSKLKVYIYTGGMQRIKGAYEVLKTFSEKIPDRDCRLLVLGFTKDFSSSGLKGFIKRILYRLGRPTYDFLVKSIAQKDSRIVCIHSKYYIKDLFDQAYCLLSYFTMPHANLAMAEAIIEGLPVIATKTEESLEYSLNGKLALLFEMNNMEAFENTISDLDSQYPRMKQMLAMYAEELKGKFDRVRNIQRLISVLDSL